MPGVLKEEQYSLPIADGFAKYPADAFEFVVGSAEQADLEAKTVRVTTAGGVERTLGYDHLVLATGTRYVDDAVPWKANGTNEEVMALLRQTQQKVLAAKHIVVAGAGATGVETAGELRYEYQDKEVVLLSSGDKILNGDAIAANAESELTKLGVKVQHNARVDSHHELPDGRTEVVLQNGEKLVTDLYLSTMGVLPNTEYLPAKVLRDDRFVAVDEFYRVKGVENVWAAGDIVWDPKGSFLIADKQVSSPSLAPPTFAGALQTDKNTGCRGCQEHRPDAQRQEAHARQAAPHGHLRLCRRPGPRRWSAGAHQGLLLFNLHDQGQDAGHADAARHGKRHCLLVRGGG